VRKIGAGDEGVLYTMQISSKRPRRKSKTPKKSFFSWLSCNKGKSKDVVGRPETNTLLGEPSTGLGAQNAQFTIKKKKRYNNPILNWLDSQNLNICNFTNTHDVDAHLYRPSNYLYVYIDWTFTASFTAVFFTFLIYYFIITLTFGILLMAAGNNQPECITSGGDHFGSNPYTRFNDAYELSWTTFTTVGYGNSYTSTAGDLVAEDGTTKAHECSLVVLMCNAEAFIGLLYAGMCGAILFGKVNRVQSHAKLIFANAVCLQYEEIVDEDLDESGADASDRSGRLFHKKWSSDNLGRLTNGSQQDGMTVSVRTPQSPVPPPFWSPENAESDEESPSLETPLSKTEQFVDQFNGCPVLKFQVVNEMCNREGSEIVDAIMKVIGIKLKEGEDGQITHSQYVRVNLVEFEHPFFSRVWHGVHILDANSPLLTDKAKRRIKENDGSWPSEWFEPQIIREQLQFNDLVVTVAGISNVSALTVHGYKRYKIGDVLIGFNFAPLVFRDHDTGQFEVDLSLCHDVREQKGGGGEVLNDNQRLKRAQSTIRITKSRDSDFMLDSQQDSQLRESQISAHSSKVGMDLGNSV
ncbi:hypothetical protein ACHAXN_009417, partial [Cyclotella atomus]